MRRKYLIFLVSLILNRFVSAFSPQLIAKSLNSPIDFFSTRLSVTPQEKEDVVIVTTEEDYEMRRYQNRAALLQATLKEKVAELKEVSEKFQLADSKTTILQDVVKRLASKEKQTQEKASQQIKEIETELDQIKSELKEQAKIDKSSIEALKQQIKDNQLDYEKKQSRQQEQLLEEKEKRGALKNEMLHLDEKLEQAQDELEKLQKTLDSKQDEAQKAINLEQKARKKLEKQLAEAVEEKEGLLAKYQNVTESFVDEDQLESIEIAKGAVKAAEKREKDVRQKLLLVERKYDDALVENRKLQGELDELRDDYKSLCLLAKEKKEEQADEVALAERLRESQEENEELRLKATRAQEQLQQEQVKFASMQKIEKDNFERILEEERSLHQLEVKRMESNLRAQDTYRSPLFSTPDKRRLFDDLESTKRPGLWKRISSRPRSWLSRRR